MCVTWWTAVATADYDYAYFCTADSALLFVTCMRCVAGIVVGNAQPELVHWLVHQPQNGKIILTESSCADGILEGLAYHGLL